MKPIMAIVTQYEKSMILDKIQLDTLIESDKWSFNVYDRITELIACKVKCMCTPCETIKHQINQQVRLIFAQTNNFAGHSIMDEIVKETCESIFLLISQTHFKIDFKSIENVCDECQEAFAISCASELLSLREENEGIVAVTALYSQLKASVLCPEPAVAA